MFSRRDNQLSEIPRFVTPRAAAHSPQSVCLRAADERYSSGDSTIGS
jgi:hypothetical protein